MKLYPTRIDQRHVGLGATVLAALLLSGCSLMPKGEPIETFLLPEHAAPPAFASPPTALALRINKPATGVRLSGHRIVVLPQDRQISVYKGAQWSDPPPVLVRNRLVDAFRTDGRIVRLSGDERLLMVDLELDTDLRTFQSEYRRGVPEVLVQLDARLIDPGLKRVVATRFFDIRQPVNGKEVPQVVEAFGRASDTLSAQVVEWVNSYAATARKAP
ncbi:MAG: ABC-type transport auxiliary lipoprotein family protein [Brachymonas sp.]|nr:ABC-type transport auxiliary lipoprotein family protein [Brachymonas sp.]